MEEPFARFQKFHFINNGHDNNDDNNDIDSKNEYYAYIYETLYI